MSFKTKTFGGESPYWIPGSAGVGSFDSMEKAVDSISEGQRIVDPVGIMQLLQFNYMCGSRTLVQGVKRMPWRAVRDDDGAVQRTVPIAHGDLHLSHSDAARMLCDLLEKELLEAIASHKNVYLLLTGGLDSRLVAGILHRARQDFSTKVTCVTWGLEKSRDVQYAKRIAGWFDWEFVCVPITPEIVWSNMEVMSTWGGAEISGLHLHNMDWFRNVPADSLVLAASFGDSIGRAEFSGSHVLQLQRPEPINHMGLIHPYLEELCLDQSRGDISSAWALLENAPDYVKWEHHQQENYMRRMICHAMDRIRIYAKLHQAFTSEPVVSFMWSLCPIMRNNEIYREAFRLLDQRLYSLPWARTGIAPDGFTTESDNSLLHDYHEYSCWCKNELRERLEEHAFNKNLYKLGFLFAPAWNQLYRDWKNSSGLTHCGTIENVTKLAQIDMARIAYGLQPVQDGNYLLDRIRPAVWRFKGWLRGADRL